MDALMIFALVIGIFLAKVVVFCLAVALIVIPVGLTLKFAFAIFQRLGL